MNQRTITLNNVQFNLEGTVVIANVEVVTHYTNEGRKFELHHYSIKSIKADIANVFKDSVTQTLKQVVESEIKAYLDIYFDDIEHEAMMNAQYEARDHADNLRNWEHFN